MRVTTGFHSALVLVLATACGADRQGGGAADAAPAADAADAAVRAEAAVPADAATPLDAMRPVDAAKPARDAAPADAAPPAPDAVAPRPRFLDYIRGDRYPRLVIELDEVPGATPNAAALDRLTARLSELLDKPGGVVVERDGDLPAAGADHAWTFDELNTLADRTFDREVPADTIKMHVLYVDGHDAEDREGQSVLGKAWRHTHLVMFPQSIAAACSRAALPLFRARVCEEAELAILTHEVGHLLGLVDNGVPMTTDHADPDHVGHDRNEHCVMYWAYEGTSGLSALADAIGGGNDDGPAFDQACLDDLAAVRGN
jgi:hypothetical protein